MINVTDSVVFKVQQISGYIYENCGSGSNTGESNISMAHIYHIHLLNVVRQLLYYNSYMITGVQLGHKSGYTTV